jgi:hypothetical protein
VLILTAQVVTIDFLSLILCTSSNIAHLQDMVRDWVGVEERPENKKRSFQKEHVQPGYSV